MVMIAGPMIFISFPATWTLAGKIVPWLSVTPVWRISFILALGLALLVGLGLEYAGRRWHKAGMVAVVLIVITSLWQWQGVLPFGNRHDLFAQSPLLARATELSGDGRLWPYNGTLDQYMPYNVPMVFGYDSVYPGTYLELWEANSEIRKKNQLHARNIHPNLLAVTATNTMLTHEAVPDGWTAVMTEGIWTLARKNETSPAVHTVKELVPETSAAQLQTIDPLNQALILGEAPGIDSTAVSTISNIDRHPESVKFALTTDKDTAVVTNLQSYPGWRLRIDGQSSAAAILGVNHAFLGAAIPAGEHVVEFYYQPRSLMVGLIISILSLVLLIVVGWWFPKRNRPVGDGAEE